MDKGNSLFCLLESSAKTYPTNVYVASIQGKHTYQETLDAALRQAKVYADAGVSPGDPVALYSGRSFETVSSIYALFLLGANVIPLDVNEPQDRVQLLLSKVAPDWVVEADGQVAASIGATSLQLAGVDKSAAAFDLSKRPNVQSDATALTFFTTGSTGQPKGIELSHGAIHSGQSWLQSAIPLAQTDRQLFRTTIGVTNLFRELIWPVMAGASFYMLEDGKHADVTAHVDAVANHGVSVIGAVPILIDAMISTAAAPTELAGLKHVICTSDVFLTEHLKRFQDAMPAAKIYNVFGLTEAPYIAWHACDGGFIEGRQVPIGQAADLSSVILNDDLVPVDANVTGRLYVAGAGMLTRYWADTALTDARCITLSGVRYFDTGDMAFKDVEGVLHLSGRSEYLVKIGGQRVDILDVEHAIAAIENVAEVCAIPYDLGGGVRRLAAWIAAKDGETVEEKQVRRILAGTLKSYMVPTEIRFVDGLPKTHNGKIDKKKLEQSLINSRKPESTAETPEDKLSEIIRSVLNITRFELYDSVISLGGDSISAFLISVRANEIGIQVEPTLMLTGTIGDAFNAPRKAVVESFKKSSDKPREVHNLGAYGWSESEIQSLFNGMKEEA